MLLTADTNISFSSSIDDTDALKLKVDEALTVYDEYVKQQQTGSAEGEGEKKEEEKKTES